LTPRQNAWKKHYLDPDNPETFFNGTASAKAAGYSTKYASLRVVGAQNKKKFASDIERWLDEEGLSEKHLKRKLFEGLDAHETKFFAHQGEVIETHDVRAWGIQHRYLELAMRVKGMLNDKLEISTDQSTMAMVVEAIQGLKNEKKG
jgi:phage terminase small subunit